MQTQEKILDAAYQCFVHFGFSASSIVMIGKYADVSRFTVHKYFKNKEDLFKEVVIHHGKTAMAQANEIVKESKPVWCRISRITEIWFAPIFNQIKDQMVFDDLRQASEKYLVEIHNEHKAFLVKTYSQLLTQANRQNEIDLSRLKISEQQIAEFIVTSIDCAKYSIDIRKIPDYIEQLIRVYSVATAKPANS